MNARVCKSVLVNDLNGRGRLGSASGAGSSEWRGFDEMI